MDDKTTFINGGLSTFYGTVYFCIAAAAFCFYIRKVDDNYFVDDFEKGREHYFGAIKTGQEQNLEKVSP